MEKDEIKVMAEAPAAEAQVGIKKTELLQKYLAENKIEGFGLQKFQDDVHSHAFRSNLPVAGTNLAFMILLDDSVYTLIQVQVAANLITEEKKAFVCEEMNKLNDQYRMLKYNVDEVGNILLSCSIPSGLEHFDPVLIIAILNQLQGHLNAIHPELMARIWKK